MTSLLAIDPGVEQCAYAWFDAKGDAQPLLREVAFYPSRMPWVRARPDHAITEIPQHDSRVGIYNVPLAVAGAYLAGCARVGATFVTPSTWKKSQRKPQHHLRIWFELTPDERLCFGDTTEERIHRAIEKGARDAWRKPGAYYYGRGRGSECHNLLDAAGLGLFEYGRLLP